MTNYVRSATICKAIKRCPTVRLELRNPLILPAIACHGGCSGETGGGTTAAGLVGLFVDGTEISLWVEHGWFVAIIMHSRSIGAADSVASRISPAAAGFPAMAASIIHSAHSQEISSPATGLRFLEYPWTCRLAFKAATAIRAARSGRASVALPTSAHTSRAFPRTTSESNAARNCSGVAVRMVAPDALTARAKSSLV